MRLIQQLKQWLTGRTRVEAPPVSQPAAQPRPAKFEILPEFEQWEQSDVMALRSFLSSPTGQKLVKICGSEIHVASLKECAGDSGSPQAYGMNQMLLFQFNLASDKMLSQASGDTDAKPNTTGGALDDALSAEFRRSF